MITDPEYEALAASLVSATAAGGAPLLEGVIKCATERDMNPHETMRLIETTNVAAHMERFKCASGSAYVEFDVVDPGIVEQRMFGKVPVPVEDPAPSATGGDGVKMASASYDAASDWELSLTSTSMSFDKIAEDAAPSEEQCARELFAKKAEFMHESSVRVYEALKNYDSACRELAVEMKVAADLGTAHVTARKQGGGALVADLEKIARMHHVNIEPRALRGAFYTPVCESELMKLAEAAEAVRNAIQVAHAVSDLYHEPRRSFETASVYGIPA